MGCVSIYRIEPQSPVELGTHFHSERFPPLRSASSNCFHCSGRGLPFLFSAWQNSIEPCGFSHLFSPYVFG